MVDTRVLGVALLVVASLLIANPLYLYQHPDEVNTVQVSAAETDAEVDYAFENLSPRAQDVVETAVESETGVTQFRGDHRRPAEFNFDPSEGTDIIAGSTYRVGYQGTTYVVRTFAEPELLTSERERSQGLFGFGVVLALIGFSYILHRQPTGLGLATGGIGLALFGANVVYRLDGPGGVVTVLSAPAVLFFAILAGIVTLGYLVYRAMRQRREAELA